MHDRSRTEPSGRRFPHAAARAPLASLLLLLGTLLPLGGCDGPDAPWTPAQSDLVFTSDHEGNSEIYLREAGSEEWLNLTLDEGADSWPVWSPDGERIAFQSDRAGNLDVYVMDADGSDVQRLTHSPAHDMLPAWSPDGRQLTFASWRFRPGDRAIEVHTYVMDANGKGQRRLIEAPPRTSSGAAWAPEGQGFLVTRRIGEQGPDLFLVDVAGSVIRRLTDDEAANGAPEFSPDGSWIAHHADTGTVSSIVVRDLEGTDVRRVVDHGRNWYPHWSPDGNWLTWTGEVGSSGVDADEAGDTAAAVTVDLDLLAAPVEGSAEPVVLVGGPGRQSEGRWRPWR